MIVAVILSLMADNPIVDARLALYLVEPSPVITEALITLFEDRVRVLNCFPNAESLLSERAALAPRRCLITELHLPGLSGIDLMLKLEREHFPTPTIITAIDGQISTAVLAIRHGAIDFVEKPYLAAKLLEGVCRVEAVLG